MKTTEPSKHHVRRRYCSGNIRDCAQSKRWAAIIRGAKVSWAIRAFAVADRYDRRCTGVITALQSIFSDIDKSFSDIDKRYIPNPSGLCLDRLSEELLYTYGYSIGTKSQCGCSEHILTSCLNRVLVLVAPTSCLSDWHFP